MKYATLAAREDINSRRYDEKFKMIAKQVEELKNQKTDLEKLNVKKSEYEDQIREIDQFMEGLKHADEYDDILVRQMVKEIRVLSKKRAVMELNTGLQIELTM